MEKKIKSIRLVKTSDNAGFAFFVKTNEAFFIPLMYEVAAKENIDLSTHTISIYGEWAGSGIQKNVAISQIPKGFFIFGVKISPMDNPNDSETVVDGVRSTAWWVDSSYLRAPDNRIFNVEDYPTYSVDVDFNMPQLVQNTFAELTEAVEKECPVGMAFGVSGIGEGIVWSTRYNNTVHRFKVKGILHSNSKVKTLPKVDNVKLNKIMEIANLVSTPNRLDQMLTQACDLINGGTIDRSKLGDYLRLVINDVLKEELDILTEAQVEPKEVNKYISQIAKDYFFDREKEFEIK